MPKVCYIYKAFRFETREIIEIANEIIGEYMAEGFTLTVRQLYYQFVARDLIANTQQSYHRLGSIISDGRLAGLIDWNAIEDRTRNLSSIAHWVHPSDIVKAAADQFRRDKWVDQTYRPEVWIEKEALTGVIEPTCRKLDIPFFACRGYVSQSEMWTHAMRLKQFMIEGQVPVIIHLGDHDPSGIDMTRDILDRQHLFRGRTEIKRIALNFDQIEEFNPPPNPAKMTDSRFNQYVLEYGDQSWELDALDPKTLARLITETVLRMRDDDKWNKQTRLETEYRECLQAAASEYNWDNDHR